MRLIILSILQSVLLCGGQVFLKFALRKMGDFQMSLSFIFNQLANMYWLGCGVCYGVATVLWMYIIKNFPFSMAYPMIYLLKGSRTKTAVNLLWKVVTECPFLLVVFCWYNNSITLPSSVQYNIGKLGPLRLTCITF